MGVCFLQLWDTWVPADSELWGQQQVGCFLCGNIDSPTGIIEAKLQCTNNPDKSLNPFFWLLVFWHEIQLHIINHHFGTWNIWCLSSLMLPFLLHTLKENTHVAPGDNSFNWIMGGKHAGRHQQFHSGNSVRRDTQRMHVLTILQGAGQFIGVHEQGETIPHTCKCRQVEQVTTNETLLDQAQATLALWGQFASDKNRWWDISPKVRTQSNLVRKQVVKKHYCLLNTQCLRLVRRKAVHHMSSEQD